jgi:hypothetical protein
MSAVPLTSITEPLPMAVIEVADDGQLSRWTEAARTWARGRFPVECAIYRKHSKQSESGEESENGEWKKPALRIVWPHMPRHAICVEHKALIQDNAAGWTLQAYMFEDGTFATNPREVSCVSLELGDMVGENFPTAMMKSLLQKGRTAFKNNAPLTLGSFDGGNYGGCFHLDENDKRAVLFETYMTLYSLPPVLPIPTALSLIEKHTGTLGRMIFDIDYKLSEPTMAEVLTDVGLLSGGGRCESILGVLLRVMRVAFPTADCTLHVFTSHSDKKASYHIVAPHVVATEATQLAVRDQVVVELRSLNEARNWEEIVDGSIYARGKGLRACFSQKVEPACPNKKVHKKSKTVCDLCWKKLPTNRPKIPFAVFTQDGVRQPLPAKLFANFVAPAFISSDQFVSPSQTTVAIPPPAQGLKRDAPGRGIHGGSCSGARKTLRIDHPQVQEIVRCLLEKGILQNSSDVKSIIGEADGEHLLITLYEDVCRIKKAVHTKFNAPFLSVHVDTGYVRFGCHNATCRRLGNISYGRIQPLSTDFLKEDAENSPTKRTKLNTSPAGGAAPPAASRYDSDLEMPDADSDAGSDDVPVNEEDDYLAGSNQSGDEDESGGADWPATGADEDAPTFKECFEWLRDQISPEERKRIAVSGEPMRGRDKYTMAIACMAVAEVQQGPEERSAAGNVLVTVFNGEQQLMSDAFRRVGPAWITAATTFEHRQNLTPVMCAVQMHCKCLPTADPVDAAQVTAAVLARRGAPETTLADAIIAWGYNKDRIFAEFNARFACTLDGSKFFVRRLEDDENLEVQGFSKFYGNCKGPGEPRSWADQWLQWKDRKSYEKMYFQPLPPSASANQASRPGQLNLWRGWGVTPRAVVDIEPLLEFIRDIICDKETDRFEYLLGWMAHLVQKPEKKLEVAVVLAGDQGAGKNTLAERILGRLLHPNHFLQVAQETQVTGRFNGHFQQRLLCFFNEAIFSGDHHAISMLKHLITDKSTTIERKGIDATDTTSYVNIVISTNSSWSAPAELGARRFAMFPVSGRRIGDAAYFASLDHLLNHGGCESFLQYLVNYDISQYDPRVLAPSSLEALFGNMLRSMTLVEQWWYEVLQQKQLPRPFASTGEPWGSGKTTWTELHDGYSNWVRQRGSLANVTNPSLCAFTNEIKRYLKLADKRLWTDGREYQGERRIRDIYLNNAGLCRKAFEAKSRIPASVLWREDHW